MATTIYLNSDQPRRIVHTSDGRRLIADPGVGISVPDADATSLVAEGDFSLTPGQPTSLPTPGVATTPANVYIQKTQPPSPIAPALWIKVNSDGSIASPDQWQVYA